MAWKEDAVRAVMEALRSNAMTTRLCALLLFIAVAGAVFLVVIHTVERG